MAAYEKEWQHVHPVDDHAASPPAKFHNVEAGTPVRTRAKCAKCRRTLALFPIGEGPESLKSLMRLR